MEDEIALFKAIWPLLILMALAFFLVWRNLGRRRNRHPAKESDIDYAPRGRSNWGDDGGGGGGDGD